jgi:hypothetical protein
MTAELSRSSVPDPGRSRRPDSIAKVLAMETSRRGFLKGTLAGSAFLAGANLLPGGCTSYDKPATSLQILNAKEFSVLQTVVDRIIGEPGPGEISATDAKVAEQFDAMLVKMPKTVSDQVKQMLQLFEHGPQVFFFSFKRFTELSPEDQDLHIASWMESSLAFRKAVFCALKKIAMSIYYATPATWPSIDYDGPWLGRSQNTGREWVVHQLKRFE